MNIELIPKWRFRDYPHIKITKDLIFYNSKTNRIKKLSLNGYSPGIWITSKRFILQSQINEHVELIPKKEYLPF